MDILQCGDISRNTWDLYSKRSTGAVVRLDFSECHRFISLTIVYCHIAQNGVSSPPEMAGTSEAPLEHEWRCTREGEVGCYTQEHHFVVAIEIVVLYMHVHYVKYRLALLVSAITSCVHVQCMNVYFLFIFKSVLL